MLDYGSLPPEINSARMYLGAGSAPMIAAAAAWDVLANGLESFSRHYCAVIARLQGESWSGGASDAMASAAAPYLGWTTLAGAMAEQAGSQARAAAAAYEAAYAATVPPALVTANRKQLAMLVVTNIFGQNTAEIGATEAVYEEMWARDSAAMYTYAASSSAATALTPFDGPPPITNAAGQPVQAASVAEAASGSAAQDVQSALSELISSVPQQLQALATTAVSNPAAVVPAPILNAFTSFNTLVAPVNFGDGISRTLTSAGSFQTGIIRSNLQEAAEAARSAGGVAKAASAPPVAGPAFVTSGTATTVGKLSVPQSWVTTNPAAGTVAEAVWLSDADLDGGPVWTEGPATNMWNGVAPAGRATSSGLFSGPTVSNTLRVAPRHFKMPRPSLGG